MTGKKNQYTSQEKLWELDDKTLKTPKHDEMVLWLLDKENVRKVVPGINSFLNEKLCMVESLFIEDGFSVQYYRKVEDPRIRIVSEMPIMTQNKFLIGYFDIVLILYGEKASGWKRYPNTEREQGKLNPWKMYPWEIFIEVKPKIDSFGATLRQLRTYQEYKPDAMGNTYLFTEDLQFKDAFESQGIQVITRTHDMKKLEEYAKT